MEEYLNQVNQRRKYFQEIATEESAVRKVRTQEVGSVRVSMEARSGQNQYNKMASQVTFLASAAFIYYGPVVYFCHHYTGFFLVCC